MQSGLALLLTVLVTLATGWFSPPAAAHPPMAQLGSGDAIVMALFSFSGTRPTNLGVKDGKLAACPASPNCVSSQAATADKEHYIEPLPGGDDAAMERLKGVIEGMERTKIISAREDYLYAEFTSALMGFVDDVEFYRDATSGTIQVRSASRLGQSDLGVNRKRVEEIRAKLAEVKG